MRKSLITGKEASYKTKLCKQFFKKDYCPYGPRCNFSHKKNIISYINLLEKIKLSKQITRELKVPKLKVFKNLTKSKK